MKHGILVFSAKLNDCDKPLQMVIRVTLDQAKSKINTDLLEAIHNSVEKLREASPNTFASASMSDIGVSLLAKMLFDNRESRVHELLSAFALAVLTIEGAEYGMLFHEEDGSTHFEYINAESGYEASLQLDGQPDVYRGSIKFN